MTVVGALHRRWKQLPIGNVTDIMGDGLCIVLAPHPDDESLGCGGLIRACVVEGRLPFVLILTDGTGSHPNSVAYPPERLRAVRRQEAIDAAGALGLPPERLHFLDEKDTEAPREGARFQALIERIMQFTRSGLVSAILAPWKHDPHCDHHAAALLAERVAALAEIRLLYYPVWGWTLPPEMEIDELTCSGWRLDVSPHLAAKRLAISAHHSQSGGLIMDDPAGFRLSAEFRSVFERPYETFLLP